MSNIVTLTFSPCIDKSAVVSELIPDKKLTCSSLKSEPGGGGLNIARAIGRLGGKALAIYPAGGYTGKALVDLMIKEGVDDSVIRSDKESRENIIIFEEKTGLQYRFGMPAPALSAQEYREMLITTEDLTAVDFIVVSGSIPAGVPEDVFTVIAGIAAQKRAKLFIDTSGPFLKRGVVAKPFLIKPNLGELAALVDKSRLQRDEILPAAMQVIEQFACANVVVSMGREGALLATRNGYWNFLPPAVDRKSTVGAGDSMMGGIMFALSQNYLMNDAVKFGVACGTAATLRPGTELCHKSDVETIFDKILTAENSFVDLPDTVSHLS